MIYPNGLLMGKATEFSTTENRLTYTKHYYIGSERISAKTGTVIDMGLYPGSLLSGQVPALNHDMVRLPSNQSVEDAEVAVKAVYAAFEQSEPQFSSLPEENKIRFDHTVSMLNYFYFHKDHLGSSSYITNKVGNVTQHMEYLPFGETLVDEHTNSFNSPFKYNGKEYDEETGNYYYSARYYDPKWSIFITVDPLAEKYPGVSSYAYCLNNPIIYTDPTGMEVDGWITTINKNGTKTHTYNASINSCEEAIAAGYNINTLEGVSKSIKVSAKDGSYAINLNANGTVTNALWGDVPVSMGNIYGSDYNFLRTEGGTDVLTNVLAIDTRRASGAITSMDFSSPFFPIGAIIGNASKGLGGIFSASSKVTTRTTTLAHYYPPNGGAMGGWSSTTLSAGTKIDRYGSLTGNYFSPAGTPDLLRALPPGNTGVLNSFQVLKPINVESSTIAPAFGKMGTGIQYRSALNAGQLVEQGYLMPIK